MEGEKVMNDSAAGRSLGLAIAASQTATTEMLADVSFMNSFALVVQLCSEALASGRKIMFAGNGGSAMDAGHLAAELSGRFLIDGPAIRAVSLMDSVASLTAIGNDLGFEVVIARQVEALASNGDVLVLLSTSGASPNIILAAQAAHGLGTSVVGWTGYRTDTALEAASDLCLRFPSNDTARIQECMMIAGHTLCQLLEQSHRLVGNNA